MNPATCPTCNGRGSALVVTRHGAITHDCPACEGTGERRWVRVTKGIITLVICGGIIGCVGFLAY